MPKSNIVLVLAGVSGSGKTTLAETIRNWVNSDAHAEPYEAIVSADKYFIQEGKYLFDPAQLPQAHSACLRQYLYELEVERRPLVMVDNTNSTNWERSPYMAIATLFGYMPWVITLATPPDVAAKRGLHGVPEQRVLQMWERMEKPLPFWNTYTPPSHELIVVQARMVLETVGLR